MEPMDKIYYKKLIRDNIPEKIRAKGSECETRELSLEEFKHALRVKIGEEASELTNAATKDDFLTELADIFIVLSEIQTIEGVSDEELEAAIEENYQKKGGFEKRLFLEWSSNDGYTSEKVTKK